DRQTGRKKERKKKTQKSVPSLTGGIVLTAAASRGALGGRDRKAYSTWYSQAVSHPSTNQARHCLASEIGRYRACSVWYGRKQLLPDKVGLIKLTWLGTCRQTGRQTHRQTHRQTDRQTDRQTNRQAERKKEKINTKECSKFNWLNCAD